MKKIYFLSTSLLFSFILSNNVQAEESTLTDSVEESITIENTVNNDSYESTVEFEEELSSKESTAEDSHLPSADYYLNNISITGGDFVFEYLYENNEYMKAKRIPTPNFKLDSDFDESQKSKYSDNLLFIEDLLISSAYYYVLTGDEIQLAYLIDASILDSSYQNIAISPSFNDKYFELNNKLIDAIFVAKSLSDEELISKIKELNLVLLPTSPLNLKNKDSFDFDIFSYSSSFLENNFDEFYKNKNNNDIIYSDSEDGDLLEQLNNYNNETDEPTKNTSNDIDSNGSNTLVILIISLIFIVFGFIFFLKNRKEE